ncbi:MAG: luciferase [Haloarculaceae archaeon]
MSSLSSVSLADVGLDAAALKPAEVDLFRATDLEVPAVAVDYEGHEHLPSPETLADITTSHDVRLTVPVRADGFDPLGDDSRLRRIPEKVGSVLVAGHPAYLDPTERARAVSPRFSAATEHVSNPWVGTEGVGRVALATGHTQFELLSESTSGDVRGLRAAGFDAGIALYAPVVLTEDEDAVLDALGGYVARRSAVAEGLPEGAPTDSSVSGPPREALLEACRAYGLVGPPHRVSERIATLRGAGVDTVVGYPARGLGPLLN